jgi:hypothetical protein
MEKPILLQIQEQFVIVNDNFLKILTHLNKLAVRVDTIEKQLITNSEKVEK